MAYFTSQIDVLPDWRTTCLRLMIGFWVSVTLTAYLGNYFVETTLPVASIVLGWLNDQFTILYLGIDHTAQDTVVRLRLSLRHAFFVGTQLIQPHPNSWLEVTTATGGLLQPLVTSLGITLAWPGPMIWRFARSSIALAASLVILLIDLNIALHANIWEMFQPTDGASAFSPFMSIHRILHGGGRLAAGIAVGVLCIALIGHQHKIQAFANNDGQP